jgi:nucleoside 2-deoxyribosyltransferase
MSNNFYIYLAGSISGLSYGEATKWRNEARNKLEDLGYKVVNPMRNKSDLSHIKELSNYNNTDRGRQIFNRDKYDVQSVDAMIVNFTGCKMVSIGTCVEIGIAVERDIPIFVIMEDDNIHNHPFITVPAYIVVNSLEDAILALEDLTG